MATRFSQDRTARDSALKRGSVSLWMESVCALEKEAAVAKGAIGAEIADDRMASSPPLLSNCNHLHRTDKDSSVYTDGLE